VFTPSRSGGAVSNPLTSSRRTVATTGIKVDEDGWGPDAPPVTRTQLEKVPSAYQPTRVNIQELTSQRPAESTVRNIESDNDARPGIVKGGYQPVGKVDIAAIRRQAQEAGVKVDATPKPVKGAYEPIGKVDIAAIRAKAQQPTDISSSGTQDSQRLSDPKTLSERPAAFQPAERLTTLPKPKVSNRFAGSPTFTGTKAPLPSDFGPKVSPTATPVGSTSRTFADEGGKTPAQLWAERKSKERGLSDAGDVSISSSSAQTQAGDGEWKSSYTGRTWATVHTSHTGLSTSSSVSQRSAGRGGELSQESEPKPPSGAVSSVRDRFASAPSVGSGVSNVDGRDPSLPPLDNGSKPNAIHDIPIPGLPTGHVESVEVYEAGTKQDVPNPPQQPRSPTPPSPSIRDSSPIRVAMPVSRNAPEEMVQDASEEQHSPPEALPIRSLEQAVPNEEELEEPTHDTARATAEATVRDTAHSVSINAVVQYDYEKAEDNEIELKEGEYVTEIEMVDKDWWLGVNARGERGLFPSNYVELVEAATGIQQVASDFPGHELSEPDVEASRPTEEPLATDIAGLDSASRGPTATALYDYEAAEDNEISFPDGAKIINIVSPRVHPSVPEGIEASIPTGSAVLRALPHTLLDL
jgi:hypothetical protein